MKLRNKSKYNFQHKFNDVVYTCNAHEEIEVCQEVADAWLKTGAFELIGDAKTEKENAELKAKLAELEKAQSKSKKKK